MSNGKVITGAFGSAPKANLPPALGATEPEVVQPEAPPAESSNQIAAPAPGQTIVDKVKALPPWVLYSAAAVGITGVGYVVWRMQQPKPAAAPRKRRFK